MVIFCSILSSLHLTPFSANSGHGFGAWSNSKHSVRAIVSYLQRRWRREARLSAPRYQLFGMRWCAPNVTVVSFKIGGCNQFPSKIIGGMARSWNVDSSPRPCRCVLLRLPSAWSAGTQSIHVCGK